jgi:hypothetical protein
MNVVGHRWRDLGSTGTQWNALWAIRQQKGRGTASFWTCFRYLFFFARQFVAGVLGKNVASRGYFWINTMVYEPFDSQPLL